PSPPGSLPTHIPRPISPNRLTPLRSPRTEKSPPRLALTPIYHDESPFSAAAHGLFPSFPRASPCSHGWGQCGRRPGETIGSHTGPKGEVAAPVSSQPSCTSTMVKARLASTHGDDVADPQDQMQGTECILQELNLFLCTKLPAGSPTLHFAKDVTCSAATLFQ
uniref:Uncharacterized protein n=1 Tax=Triticum urartu TaxID=4572 RepID=A0A8R7QEE0_TRIUA